VDRVQLAAVAEVPQYLQCLPEVGDLSLLVGIEVDLRPARELALDGRAREDAL